MIKRISPLLIIMAGCMWGTISWFVLFFDRWEISDNNAKLFIRTFGAVIMFGVFILFYRPSLFKFKLKDIWIFLTIGVGCLFGFNIALYHNIVHTSANFATVLLYTAPIFVMLISIVLFKEKMTTRKLVALVCVCVGCAFVSGLVGGLSDFSFSGLIIGLVSGFAYGMYTIMTEIAIRRGYDTLTINFWMFFWASVACLIFGGVAFDQLAHAISLSPIFSIFIMILYATINAVLPYVLYSTGLKYVETGRAAIMASCEPVVGTLGALILFSQVPTILAWIGMALVITAIVILNLPKREKGGKDATT